MSKPYVIKEYDELYFIYKPPFCEVFVGDKTKHMLLDDYLKKYNNFATWIYNNFHNKINKDITNDFGILNRLDYETSGIIVVAKNYKML